MTTALRDGLNRWKYYLNGTLLLAPAWFFYQALLPGFPSAWPERNAGPFTAAPIPVDEALPYRHDDGYLKDFSVRFCAGCVGRIRIAHLSVGDRPGVLPDDLLGILHGTGDLQHAHAPYPALPGTSDRLWLTVQEWSGQVHHADWPLQGMSQ